MSGTSNNNNSGGGKRSWWGARFFGSNPRSINVPLAAFCMAVVLTTYCVTSIRSARRNVRYETIKAPHTTTTAAAAAAAGAVDEGGKVDEDSSSSWLIQQLEARREEGRVREGRARGLREGKAGR